MIRKLFIGGSVLVALLPAVCSVAPFFHGREELTYQQYYSRLSSRTRAIIPPCDLSFGVKCGGENGKVPTLNQSILWEGFVIEHACDVSSDVYACDEKGN